MHFWSHYLHNDKTVSDNQIKKKILVEQAKDFWISDMWINFKL